MRRTLPDERAKRHCDGRIGWLYFRSCDTPALYVRQGGAVVQPGLNAPVKPHGPRQFSRAPRAPFGRTLAAFDCETRPTTSRGCDA
jgi:hypothetical protein